MEHAPNVRQACCGPPAQAGATAPVSCAAIGPARNIWKENPVRPMAAAHGTAAQTTHQKNTASPNRRDITVPAEKRAAAEHGLS